MKSNAQEREHEAGGNFYAEHGTVPSELAGGKKVVTKEYKKGERRQNKGTKEEIIVE